MKTLATLRTGKLGASAPLGLTNDNLIQTNPFAPDGKKRTNALWPCA
jgi:hypothetical protein